MRQVTVEFGIQEGGPPENANPQAFREHVKKELRSLQKKSDEFGEVREKTTPAPPEVTGISEFTRWLLDVATDNQEAIETLLRWLPMFIRGLSHAATRYHMARSVAEGDDEPPTITVEVAGERIELPAESDTVEAFEKAVRNALGADS